MTEVEVEERMGRVQILSLLQEVRFRSVWGPEEWLIMEVVARRGVILGLIPRALVDVQIQAHVRLLQVVEVEG